MVGTLEPRKGHRIALDAFEALWADGLDVCLVIAGKHGWGVDHLAEAIRTHREFGKRLFWHERVDDAGLAQLYSDCDGLIAASFAEGFGLPIVEAGYFGKPVIASDIPVFREVGDGAVERRFFSVGSSSRACRNGQDVCWRPGQSERSDKLHASAGRPGRRAPGSLKMSFWAGTGIARIGRLRRGPTLP